MKYQQLKSIILIFIIIFSVVIIPCKASDQYNYIYDGEHNTIFIVDLKKEGTIYFYGKHVNSTTKITYHTTGFNIALSDSNKNVDKVPYKFIPRIEDGDMGDINKSLFAGQGYKYDTYKLTASNVVKSLQSLMRTQKDSKGKLVYKDGKAILTALAKGVTVYFSNEFEILNRKTGQRVGSKTYKTLAEMKNAASWSKKTLELLPYYYDNPLKVQLTPYTYDVVYMDQEEYNKHGTKGKILKTVEKDQPSVFAAEIEYDFKDQNHLKFNGTEYEYAGGEYCYDSGLKNMVNKPKLENGIITVEHGRTDNAVLYVLLKKKTPAVPVIKPDETESAQEENSEITDKLDPKATVTLASNTFSNEIYDAETAIPATEYLYAIGQAKEYLLNIRYEKKTGTCSIPVTAEKTYQVKQKDGSYQNQTVTQSGSVSRSYEYTQLTEIDYYSLKEAVIKNAALSEGKVTLRPKNAGIPELTYHHEDSVSWHIEIPSTSSTVTLPSEKVDKLPNESLISLAESQIGEVKARSDSLEFGRKTVLSSQWSSETGDRIDLSGTEPEIKKGIDFLYEEGLQIPADTKNLSYETKAEIIYERKAALHSNLADTLTYQIANIAPVTVHTPVVCHGEITNDNNEYVQVFRPDLGAYPVVLDNSSTLCDFKLKISNEGYHSTKKGYETRDYGKYVKHDGNEVQFPVAIYADIGNDGRKDNDILVLADTWYPLSDTAQRFYFPVTATEGVYTVKLRSRAVNSDGLQDYTQQYYNESMENYTAVDSFKIQVSGRMYGFNLYNINDYPKWESVFLKQGSDKLKKLEPDKFPSGVKSNKFLQNAVYNYTPGTKNAYGKETGRLEKYTLPMLSDAHPLYRNQGRLKTGYTSYFSLATTGSVMEQDNAKVVVTPRFYYVDKKGNNRQEVDLYYHAFVNGKLYPFIKIGGALDVRNQKSVLLSDPNLGIPGKVVAETASRAGLSEAQFMNQKQIVYTYSKITPVKTYGDGLTQYYYFAYSLPSKLNIVKKNTDLSVWLKKGGLTGKEDIFLKNGYLIVNFDIKALDETGQVRFSYQNKENHQHFNQCSMWVMEGMTGIKTEADHTKFQVYAGDVMIYSTEESSRSEFISQGIY